MDRKDRIDAFGAAALIGFSFLMGLNQVLIKMVNAGFSPIFQAGLRSTCALGPVLLFALIARRRLSVMDGTLVPGVLCGLCFTLEFLLLFNALEYTTVGRASVLFYTMPVWVAVAANFLIPGEGLTPRRLLGLALAMGGVAVALLDEAPAFTPDALTGDLMCLAGAVLWAGIALLARLTRLSRATPEMQLTYQLTTSAVVLMPIALVSGDVIREITMPLLGIFAFQVLVVVCVGFLSWFWILRIYPASDMTAYSFLAPLFGVLAGWIILDEPITASILIALAMVGVGIALISWRRKILPVDKK